MSIKCSTRVWDYSSSGGNELLVLLAISDHAHDDGSGAWPSIKTLATKCRISSRSVQRHLRELENKGELKTSYGNGPHGTNLYSILTGLSASENIKKIICYMCSREEDDDVIFDEHHRIPGDDETIVDLCRECHIRLHQLIDPDVGGDRLTPPQIRGDKNKNVGDKKNNGGDNTGTGRATNTSPKPSLTINKQSINQPSLNNAGKPAKQKTPPLTEGQRYLLDAFGAKRYKTNIQRDTVLELEEKHGLPKLKEGVDWTALRGMNVSQAVISLKTALPKWGKPKPSTKPKKTVAEILQER